MSRSKTMGRSSLPTMTQNQRPSARLRALTFNACQRHGFMLDTDRFVVRLDPTDLHAWQQLRRTALQEFAGNGLGSFTRWQRFAHQVQRNVGKAFERSIGRHHGAEMLASQAGVSAVLTFIAP